MGFKGVIRWLLGTSAREPTYDLRQHRTPIPAPAAAPFDNAIYERGRADDRLQLVYDKLQAGEITLADYRDAIMEEQDAAKADRESLREDRRYMDRIDYENEKELADEDLEATRWRLGWVDRQIREAENAPERGRWARFEYADQDGVLTKHNITMWKAQGGKVIGYDRAAKVERTFEESRITDWVSG